jgi:hypothetical protein
MSERQIASSVALEALRGAHDECRVVEAERDAAVARAEAAEADAAGWKSYAAAAAKLDATMSASHGSEIEAWRNFGLDIVKLIALPGEQGHEVPDVSALADLRWGVISLMAERDDAVARAEAAESERDHVRSAVRRFQSGVSDLMARAENTPDSDALQLQTAAARLHNAAANWWVLRDLGRKLDPRHAGIDDSDLVSAIGSLMRAKVASLRDGAQ